MDKIATPKQVQGPLLHCPRAHSGDRYHPSPSAVCFKDAEVESFARGFDVFTVQQCRDSLPLSVLMPDELS
jgi:hypothetical protein